MLRSEWETFQAVAADLMVPLAAHGYTWRWLPSPRRHQKGYVALERAGLEQVFKASPELLAFRLGWLAARWTDGEIQPGRSA